ncbi:hypothetical protein HRbin34_00446 [bacterium HR34]|nr:hypothetical protein HRbin34_00446 [bacterium HR34]
MVDNNSSINIKRKMMKTFTVITFLLFLFMGFSNLSFAQNVCERLRQEECYKNIECKWVSCSTLDIDKNNKCYLKKQAPICLNLDFPEFGGYDLNEKQSLVDLIAWAYYFMISLSALFAFIKIVIGGFRYLTSGGNSAQMQEAKEDITYAIIGLVVIAVSFIVIQFINPDLLIIKLPSF